MSDTSEQRIDRLERQVRRLHGLVLVVAVGVAGALTLGAASKPDELKLKRLAIVDDKGRERIVAETAPDGMAAVQHFDRDGKRRIVAGTSPGGAALVSLSDRDGKAVWGEFSE